jgi:hypothetical protein
VGYAVVLATGGPNVDINPIGFREHVNPAYQGLRHIRQDRETPNTRARTTQTSYVARAPSASSALCGSSPTSARTAFVKSSMAIPASAIRGGLARSTVVASMSAI